MTTSVAILSRNRSSGKWGLVSFTETPTPESIEAAKTAKINEAARWSSAYPDREFIVSMIDANRCRSVNNLDGFPNAARHI